MRRPPLAGCGADGAVVECGEFPRDETALTDASIGENAAGPGASSGEAGVLSLDDLRR